MTPIRRVTLPRALDADGVRLLHEQLADALGAPGGILVLCGQGAEFCTGLDLASVFGGGSVAALRAAVMAFAGCLEKLGAASKPTVALVEGRALGGGLGLAAACDVVLATERARFSLPETLLGLLPAVILPALLERMPPQKVRMWSLTGAAHDAREAHAAGLVDEVVTSSTEEALARWARLLGRVRPPATVALRRLLRDSPGSESRAALTFAALADEETLGAIQAFVHEGLPPWEDR